MREAHHLVIVGSPLDRHFGVEFVPGVNGTEDTSQSKVRFQPSLYPSSNSGTLLTHLD